MLGSLPNMPIVIKPLSFNCGQASTICLQTSTHCSGSMPLFADIDRYSFIRYSLYKHIFCQYTFFTACIYLDENIKRFTSHSSACLVQSICLFDAIHSLDNKQVRNSSHAFALVALKIADEMPLDISRKLIDNCVNRYEYMRYYVSSIHIHTFSAFSTNSCT